MPRKSESSGGANTEKLRMTSTMPFYKIIFQDANQNIKDVTLPSHTIIKKFIITEKKRKGLKSV